MKKTNIFSIILNGFGYFLTIEQTNQLFQLISLIASIIASGVIIALNVWKWWIVAKKDGKIDEHEVDQLIDIVKGDKENDTTKEQNTGIDRNNKIKS